jgi:hypothetical protein
MLWTYGTLTWQPQHDSQNALTWQPPAIAEGSNQQGAIFKSELALTPDGTYPSSKIADLRLAASTYV